MSSEVYENEKSKITEKACLCCGLANASYLENDIAIKGQEQGVVICPGPNIAYFDKQVPLLKMVKHIYGNDSILSDPNRPNMFVKELKMYIDYFKNEIASISGELATNQIKRWHLFKTNLLDGIDYYQDLFLTHLSSENTKLQQALSCCKEEVFAVLIPELELR